MQGYVLLKKSQMAYDLRDAHRVVTLAEAAQHGPWQLPHKIRAEVTQQAALGLAMIGEPMSKVECIMDEARELANRTKPPQSVCRPSRWLRRSTLNAPCGCYMR